MNLGIFSPLFRLTEVILIGELFVLPEAPKTAIQRAHLLHLQW